MKTRARLATALLPIVAGAGQLPPPEHRNFLACPLVQEANPSCWLAQFRGDTYYLGPSGEAFQQKHEVLVEGVVTDKPRICGGIVLEQLTVSPQRELNLSCTTSVLPAQGTPPPPRNVRATPRPVAVPEEPAGVREFSYAFGFDSDRLASTATRPFAFLAEFIRAHPGARVEVRGTSSAALLSSGQVLQERAQIARLRAERLAAYLVDLGVPADSLATSWSTESPPPDGVADAQLRKVTITVRRP